MKKSILIAAAFLLSVVSAYSQWGNKKVEGNGNMKTETRKTSAYDEISCGGSFDFVLVKGTEGSITVEAEENLMEYIIVEVKDNDLVIKSERKVNLKPSRGKQIKITIPFQDIESVSLAGSGNLTSSDVINASDFKASVAGSGDMDIEISANNTKASIAGSGNLQLKGKTNDLKGSVAGSGDLKAFGLTANNVEISIAGSGDADVICNGNLKARVAGSGDINYKGNPTSKDTKVAGSGKITMN